jgi:hypothetical protein
MYREERKKGRIKETKFSQRMYESEVSREENGEKEKDRTER